MPFSLIQRLHTADACKVVHCIFRLLHEMIHDEGAPLQLHSLYSEIVSAVRQRLQKVSAGGVVLPEEVRGFLILMGNNTSESDFKMLLTLTGGSIKEKEVTAALTKLEKRIL